MVNAAFRGGRTGGGYGPMRGRGDGGFCGGRGGSRGSHNNNRNKIPCQVCGKTGHSALSCYKRFDASYTREEKHVVNAATMGYNIGINWYTDTGATDHIIFELDKLPQERSMVALTKCTQ
jgi:hypothetical protein